MFNKLSKIKLDEFPKIDFYPFHQLKKINGGVEPYIKTLLVGKYSYSFFKINGVIYAIKPTQKNDISKVLCGVVKNPITIDSAQGSISGNCARGVKEEFMRYSQALDKEELSKNEIFIKLLLG